MALHGSHHHFPGGYQDFFVRQRDLLSLLDGFIRGGKADDAHCGRNNHFRVGMRGDAFDSFGAEKYFGTGLRGLPAPMVLLQSGAEFARAGFRGDRNYLRAILRHLFGDQGDIRSRSQRYDFKLPGCASITLKHWRPMEPVEPRIAIFFIRL